MAESRGVGQIGKFDRRRQMTHKLPFSTPEFPGTGGIIKSCPDDFIVEEIPLYAPCGEGAHMYLLVRKVSLTTRQVSKKLAKLLDVPVGTIGAAGLKDKDAITTQWFSVPAEAFERMKLSDIDIHGVQILNHGLHGNKLKVGHLIGNRFSTRVRFCRADSSALASAIIERLIREGMVNYYGEQRFGAEGNNIRNGKNLLLGEEVNRDWFLKRLLMASYQSHLFNGYTLARHRAGLARTAMKGDVLKKVATGGLFICEDPVIDTARIQTNEIVLTGPMVGCKVMTPMGESLIFEREVLELMGFGPEMWSAVERIRLAGSRRPVIVYPGDVSISEDDAGLLLCFSLPKGSFATILLREIIKPDEDYWCTEIQDLFS